MSVCDDWDEELLISSDPWSTQGWEPVRKQIYFNLTNIIHQTENTIKKDFFLWTIITGNFCNVRTEWSHKIAPALWSHDIKLFSCVFLSNCTLLLTDSTDCCSPAPSSLTSIFVKKHKVYQLTRCNLVTYTVTDTHIRVEQRQAKVCFPHSEVHIFFQRCHLDFKPLVFTTVKTVALKYTSKTERSQRGWCIASISINYLVLKMPQG